MADTTQVPGWPCPHRRRHLPRAGLVLVSLIVVAAVATLNLSMANVALPSIGRAFDSSQTTLDLIAVGYALGVAASVLYLGALGDRYGRKLMLLLGVVLSVPAACKNMLTKSFSSAADTAQQYPQYSNQITAAAKSSFLSRRRLGVHGRHHRDRRRCRDRVLPVPEEGAGGPTPGRVPHPGHTG